ncbi:MAG: hypothetical protein HQL50_03740 [Magnetococcales bacterium]|nr:hypothetical protein [Magnetococcales bacterium]
MDTKLLIRITAPRINNEKSSGVHSGKETVLVATGYTVAKDLVLTTRHLFVNKDRDREQPFKLHWYDTKDLNEGGTVTLKDDAIVWGLEEKQEGNPDVVLIKATFPPKAVSEWGYLSDKPQKSHALWNSSGFPQVASHDEHSPHAPFIGEVSGPSDNELTLFCKDHPEQESGWKGASGMPIFNDNMIIGVARAVPGGYGAKRIFAVPMTMLLSDPDFSKHVGWYDYKNYQETARQEMIKALMEGPDAVLEELERKKRCDIVAVYDPQQRVEQLVDTLLNQRAALIGILEGSYYDLKREKPHEPGALSTIHALVIWGMPLFLGQGYAIPAPEDLEKGEVISANLATDFAVEVKMAQRDGQKPSFPKNTDAEGWPAGAGDHTKLMEQLPETGFSSSYDVLTQLEEQIEEEYGNKKFKEERGRAAYLKFVNHRIRNRAERGRTPYLSFMASGSDLDQYRKLQKDYWEIVFINRSPNDDLFFRETKEFEKYHEIVIDEADVIADDAVAASKKKKSESS